MLLKTANALWDRFRNRKSRYIHARGCTLSVAEHVHHISSMARVKNVNFDPRLILPVNIAYWQMRTKRFLNRFIT
jgi:hypothetical protein